MEEKYSINMRKVRRKKITPDYAPWGVQCENRKNTSATQKHIHDIATGEVNPAQQAAIWSRSLRRWSDPLDRLVDQSERRRVVEGGAMSVMSVGWGRNARASHCIALPGWIATTALPRPLCRGARKR